MTRIAIDDGDVRVWHGDVIDCLREMPQGLAQTCVTSPPYWGLRDYGEAGQIGLEATPYEYVERMVDVFREVRRVLRDDGTLWLNLGDTYASAQSSDNRSSAQRSARSTLGPKRDGLGGTNAAHVSVSFVPRVREHGLKPKDLVGIPWRVAFALQADGWYLRSDIVWSKPNPMPESVTDRPTKSHEYIFLLAKSARYFYDADAISEKAVHDEVGTHRGGSLARAATGKLDATGKIAGYNHSGDPWVADGRRNARTVWTVATKPYAEAHFAVFPTELPERCIKAGSGQGDTVLDPFMGSGTTAYVARHLGRRAVGCELNADYIEIQRKRLQQLSLLGDAS